MSGAILATSGAREVTKLRALEMSFNRGEEREIWTRLVTKSDIKAIYKYIMGRYFTHIYI